jgi:outer membrane protein assembly factor BamB
MTFDSRGDGEIKGIRAKLGNYFKPVIALLGNTRRLTIIVLLVWPSAGTTREGVSVLTQHNDNFRTGANLKEKILMPENVTAHSFGKLFELVVDGDIYAQPLYLETVNIPGKHTPNVVYVATMHNTVYAFDADRKTDQPLWKLSLGPPATLDNNNDFSQDAHENIQREIGIVSTPVISTSTGALYVVTFTGSNGKYKHYLHALDLTAGRELFGGPREIESTGFDSRWQNQRAGLLLSKSTIYVAFASYGDSGPYHGWIFGFDAATLKPLETVFNTTPYRSSRGGIWQAGNGPAADEDGNIYVSSGNGDFSDGTNYRESYGNSIIKLKPDLSFADRFTPWNAKELNAIDLDLGSGGPLLLPLAANRQLLVGGGKEGKLYVLDRQNLGGFCSSCKAETGDRQIVQWFIATGKPCQPWNRDDFPDNGCGDLSPSINSQGGNYHLHGSPIYWRGQGGPFVYIWGEASKFRRFKFDETTGKFDLSKTVESSYSTPTRSMPGAFLSLSANGGDPKTGIVWATHPTGCRPTDPKTQCTDKKSPTCWCDANVGVFPGMLRAIDASSLKELWNSNQNPDDQLGYSAKFTAATIANGRVYVATFAEPAPKTGPAKLVVYGLHRNARVQNGNKRLDP